MFGPTRYVTSGATHPLVIARVLLTSPSRMSKSSWIQATAVHIAADQELLRGHLHNIVFPVDALLCRNIH